MEENFEDVIKLGEILKSLKKRWRLIFICTMIITILVTAVTLLFIKPKYETSTKLFVGKEHGSKEAYNNSDVQMYQQFLKTYAQVIKTRDIAKAAVEKGNLEVEVKDIIENLSVVTLADTQILQIKYESENPEEALLVINLIKEEFMETSVELVPNGNIQVLEEAQFPEEPISPNKGMNITVGLIIGLMIGVGAAFLLEFMDNTFKSKDQLEKALDIPVLGAIPTIKEN